MKYHKIITVYERNPETNYKTLLEGKFATPEFEFLQKNEWVFTEKIDGTNIRIMWDGDSLRFGGKTENAQIPIFLYDKLQDTFTPEYMNCIISKKDNEELDAILFGEGYGNKIQKVGKSYIGNGVNFILFDVNINGIWLERENVEAVAEELDIPIVPIVGKGILAEGVFEARSGFTSQVAEDTEMWAEGLVMRPAVEMQDRRGRRIITKIKRRDFTEKK